MGHFVDLCPTKIQENPFDSAVEMIVVLSV